MTSLRTWENRRISRRQHQLQIVECAVVGCSKRTPRDSKRRISFHRLPLKSKPLLKEWQERIKGQVFPNLARVTSVRSTLRRSVSKVAVTSISGPPENINASWTKTLSRQYFLISKRKAEGLDKSHGWQIICDHLCTKAYMLLSSFGALIPRTWDKPTIAVSRTSLCKQIVWKRVLCYASRSRLIWLSVWTEII